VDATTIGALLAFAGVASGAVVTFIGKRGENGVTSFNSVTDQIQEEVVRKTTELAAAQTENARLNQQRHDDLIRITQLEIEIYRLGGTPPP
jgi:outer membrane murein-binding lipoprotein Lpp